MHRSIASLLHCSSSVGLGFVAACSIQQRGEDSPSRATPILPELDEWTHFQRGASSITSMALLLWRFRAGGGVSADPGRAPTSP